MTNHPDDDDGAVLSELAAQGLDMTQPLLIEFAVSVPDEEAAEKCLYAMTAAGYETYVEFDEGEPDYDPEVDDDDAYGPSWTLYANVLMVPEHSEIVRIQSELDNLAQPFDGQSSGWGVMISGDEDVED